MNAQNICQPCLFELEGKADCVFDCAPAPICPARHCFVCSAPASVVIDLDQHADKLAGPCPEHG